MVVVKITEHTIDLVRSCDLLWVPNPSSAEKITVSSKLVKLSKFNGMFVPIISLRMFHEVNWDPKHRGSTNAWAFFLKKPKRTMLTTAEFENKHLHLTQHGLIEKLD